MQIRETLEIVGERDFLIAMEVVAWTRARRTGGLDASVLLGSVKRVSP